MDLVRFVRRAGAHTPSLTLMTSQIRKVSHSGPEGSASSCRTRGRGHTVGEEDGHTVGEEDGGAVDLTRVKGPFAKVGLVLARPL